MPQGFALLVDWVYGSQLQHAYEGRSSGKVFVELYFLADYLGMEMLMNRAIDLHILRPKSVKWSPDSNIDIIYNRSTRGNLIRQYVARHAAYHITSVTNKNDFDELLEEIPGFACDFLKHVQFYHFCSPAEKRNPPRNEPLCNFHSHKYTPKCK